MINDLYSLDYNMLLIQCKVPFVNARGQYKRIWNHFRYQHFCSYQETVILSDGASRIGNMQRSYFPIRRGYWAYSYQKQRLLRHG